MATRKKSSVELPETDEARERVEKKIAEGRASTDPRDAVVADHLADILALIDAKA